MASVSPEASAISTCLPVFGSLQELARTAQESEVPPEGIFQFLESKVVMTGPLPHR